MADAAQLQREMLETVRSRDFAALRALYHPDYIYTGADGVERRGADAGVAIAEMYTSAFPDLEFEIRHAFAAGADASITEFTARGTHDGPLEGLAPTGRRVEVMVCNVVEARDGRIIREREYFDEMTMLRQLGAVPETARA